jgi:hypothetical protein
MVQFVDKKLGHTRSRGGKKKRSGDGARREEQHMVHSGSEGGESPKDALFFQCTQLEPSRIFIQALDSAWAVRQH